MRRLRPSRPTVLDLRVGPLVSFYGERLGDHGLQELFAGIGIAIGVALMFGVLIASQSITSSAGQALHGIIGSAQLQLAARSPDGFDQGEVKRVARLPRVAVAAPLLRADSVIAGPSGRRAIQLVGVTPSQIFLKGAATRNLDAALLAGGVGLPSGVAGEIGASASGRVTLFANGESHRLLVHAVFGSQEVGPIANSPIAIGVLPLVQTVVGKPRRVTQILVAPDPGAGRQVAAELRRLAAGRLDVLPADHELTVLKATASPTEQSSRLFAAIGAIVGFLLAANAMLFTVPERRRWMAVVREQGYGARQIALILASQALILGVIASLVGIVLGDLLSRTLFSAVPSYLTLAFPIGTHPIIPVGTAALAVGGGVLATLCASAAPLRDLLPSRPIDHVLHAVGKVGHSIDRSTLTASVLLGVTAILGVSLLVLLVPSLSILGGVLLGFGVVCLVPFFLVIVVRGLLPGSERVRGSMLSLGLIELDGTATRSIALAGVAGLAIYGSIAVQGAQRDLVKGLDNAVAQYLGTADVWVTTTGDNFLTVDGFKDRGAAAAIAHAPGVASVRVYQGALLDVGSRRLWIRARPSGDRSMIQASQLLHGAVSQATRLIRERGWAAVSNGFASERRLAVGGRFTLPTPAGAMSLRIAAITTNTGWPPGAITINADDYRRWWQTSDPTALEVNLIPGVDAAAGRRAVVQALGRRPGLLVQSLQEREAQYKQSARQGVKSLTEISGLILIAAALAIACALGATISARKADLAERKAEGYGARQLWRSLLLESTVLLGVGALDGAVCGVYGHALASRWLRLSQGFPAPFSPGALQVLETLAIVSAIAVTVIGFFGLAVARVPPRLSVQE